MPDQRNCETCLHMKQIGAFGACQFIRQRPTGVEHHMRMVATQEWFVNYEMDERTHIVDCPEHRGLSKLILISEQAEP
jgi:hypothetical protein